MEEPLILRYGTQLEYDAIRNKIPNALYFIHDTRRIYKGDKLHASNDVEFTNVVPAYKTATHRLYVVTIGNHVSLYVKGIDRMICVNSTIIQPGAINDLSAFDATILATALSGDNDTIPTSGKVNEMISDALVNCGDAYIDVASSRAVDNSGTLLTFTARNGQTKSITISDLFVSGASYNSDTHILSLSVQGGNVVDINLSDLVPETVTTSNVNMSRDIVATVDIGNIKKGQILDTSMISDLQTFLETMISQDSLPTVTQPSVTLTTTDNKIYEVGTVVCPTFSATFSAGEYSQTAAGDQVDTGVNVIGWSVTGTGQPAQTFNATNHISGSFGEIVVKDDTEFAIIASATHTAGATPKSYLGKFSVGDVPTSTKAITAGTKNDDNNPKIRGYRKTFYGALVTKSATIDNALVRGLPNSTTSSVSVGSKLIIDVPAGYSRVVLAYPATLKDVTSITSAEEFGSEIKDSFTKYIVSVEGAAAGHSIDYKVYVKDLASPQLVATTYSVMI